MEQDHRRRLVAEKAFLDWQDHDRLSRAAQSKHRRVLDFSAGDLVYIWRKQLTGEDAQQNKIGQGRFVGPARILATENKRDSAGHLIPGSSIWLVRGRRLLKCCPEQLRHATGRETVLLELHETRQLPRWDFPRVAEELGGTEYDDLSEQPEEDEWLRAGNPDHEWQPTHRLSEKRHRPRSRTPPPRPYSGHPTGAEEYTPTEPARSRSPRSGRSEPAGEGFVAAPHWSEMVDSSFFVDSTTKQQQEVLYSIEIEMPNSRHGMDNALKDLKSFLVTALKRKAIEISERFLTPEERLQFQAAKSIEVNNFLAAKAFEALPPDAQISRDQAINMRWILVWKTKPDGSRKAKARAVLQGYQDPHYEERATHSPTTTRQSRQLQLQISASMGFDTKKGDVTGAFLQSREYPDDLLCIPCPEILEAMNLPPKSITKVKKACYGLVDAPLEWYRSISSFFASLGLKKSWSDPCCWTLTKDGYLRGIITGHVDDFLFSGKADDPVWQHVEAAIQKEYKWSDWEQKSFVQCGVLIEHEHDGTYSLSQRQYVEDLKYINIRASRKREKHSPTEEIEKTHLRALLGGISWHAQQVAPHFAAEVSLLLSEVNHSTVETLFTANRLLDHVKSMKDHRLKIHPIPLEDLVIVAWADAAAINRYDGGSTQGIVIGATSRSLLKGECTPVSIVAWNSSKIGRVCSSPGSSEAIAAANAEDLLYFCRFQISEMMGNEVNIRDPNTTVNKIDGCLVTDSRNVYDKLKNEVIVAKGAERRTDVTLMRIKEGQSLNKVKVRWVHSEAQLANGLTKAKELRQLLLFYQLGSAWKIVEDPTMSSAKKRKEKGQGPLEDQPGVSTDSPEQPALHTQPPQHTPHVHKDDEEV